MNQPLSIVATIAGLAFLTAPIWYPLWCANRVLDAYRQQPKPATPPVRDLTVFQRLQMGACAALLFAPVVFVAGLPFVWAGVIGAASGACLFVASRPRPKPDAGTADPARAEFR